MLIKALLINKRIIKRLFLLFLVLNLSQTIFADPLLLTDAEMKKLQQYFPNQESDDQKSSLVWNGNPLKITLPLNKEKRIIFQDQVLPDLKGQLTTDQLRLYNDNKSLYLTALKPFASTRLFVTEESTGDVILIDLSTDKEASAAPTNIDLVENNHPSSLTTRTVNNADSLSAIDNSQMLSMSDNDDVVTLIRFAWQQLYAPERLLSNPLNISRAPMHISFMLSTLVYGDKVYAHPLASWVYNGSYITAIELRNKYSHATTINLSRDLCGDWKAASLYPHILLKPAGNKSGDSTVLFLVSQKPFAESMEVCNVHA